MKKEKIGLALSGGAARGYAEIPIVQKLLDKNVKIDLISGSSAGAIVGAYLALFGEINSLVEKIEKITTKEWLKLIDLSNPKKSIIKGEKIKKLLTEIFDDKDFNDTKIKLIIVATNIETNKPFYFTSGKIVDAIMYSLAIPGIFPLKEHKGKYLTDGQISEHLPIDILFEKGATKVIGVDVLKNIKINIDEIQKSSLNLLLSIFYKLLVTSQIPDGKNIFVFSPNFTKSKTKIGNNLRFDKVQENMAAGEITVKNEWNEFEKWLKK